MNQAYPQFNLKTLQLPAPASNMTKAEYKEAYGIDLDDTNIKAFKLVLFGNEKYPIEQIKEVEDGYEIYFNGHILSITDIVQTSNEVYNVANSKPIYCHPLAWRDSDNSARVACLIFNNSAEPFTPSSFADFIDTLYNEVGETIRILASGGFISDSVVCIASLVGYSATLKYYITGMSSTDGSNKSVNYATKALFVASMGSFTDGVNKIN